MALTRKLAIRDRILTPENLSRILSLLSKEYQTDPQADKHGDYSLVISENEERTISFNTVPESFLPLLNTPIEGVNLSFSSFNPQKAIDFFLQAGANSRRNCLVVTGEQEQWVHSVYNEALRLVEEMHPQSVFLRKWKLLLALGFGALCWFPCADIVGWVKHLAKSDPSTDKFFLGGLIALVFVTQFAYWTMEYWGEHAYPGIEFQTGPLHTRSAENLRRKIKWIMALLVLGPSSNLLYDFYKRVF